MKAIDTCTSENVEIRRMGGPDRVPAFRCQDFAVHQLDGVGQWRISHLPSGYLVARGFDTKESAAEAMIRISKLRNDWAVIEDGDLTLKLRNQVDEVAQRYGGHVTGGHRKFETGLNGYAVHS